MTASPQTGRAQPLEGPTGHYEYVNSYLIKTPAIHPAKHIYGRKTASYIYEYTKKTPSNYYVDRAEVTRSCRGYTVGYRRNDPYYFESSSSRGKDGWD